MQNERTDQSSENERTDQSRSVDSYRVRGSEGLIFDHHHTVLLVIDPVNDFLSEGGAGWEMTKGTVKKNDVVENLRRVIEGAREREIRVVFGPMAYTQEDYADEELQRRSAINRLMFEHKMFQAGTWGADFHPDLQPTDDEIVLRPHKGIDVFETDLPEHLERLNTTHLVIAGMTANLCCESTGRHAMEHGYDVTYIKDAIGAESLPAYEASIHLNYPLIANAVITVDDFLAAADQSEGAIHPGDTVFGSDHGEIGTVKEVVPVGPDRRGYLLVPRGLIFEKDTFIPLDAVVKKAGDRVFINIPKLIVGKMPWSEPPSVEGYVEKLGPPRDKVEQLYGSRSPTT